MINTQRCQQRTEPVGFPGAPHSPAAVVLLLSLSASFSDADLCLTSTLQLEIVTQVAMNKSLSCQDGDDTVLILWLDLEEH